MIRLAAAIATSLCYVEFEEVKFVSEVFLNGKQSDISIEGVLLLAVPNRFCSMIDFYMLCMETLIDIVNYWQLSIPCRVKIDEDFGDYDYNTIHKKFCAIFDF